MDEDLAMQMRCVHCLCEQYMPAVWAVSAGEEPCVWCGEMSAPMTVTEYSIAMQKAWQAESP